MNPRRPAQKCTGRLLGCHRISVQTICYESPFIFLTRKMDDKLVLLDVRLAKANGVEALEHGNVGLVVGQLAQTSLWRCCHGQIGGAVTEQDFSTRRGLPALAATDLPFEAAAFHPPQRRVGRLTWPAAGSVTHDPADAGGQHSHGGK